MGVHLETVDDDEDWQFDSQTIIIKRHNENNENIVIFVFSIYGLILHEYTYGNTDCLICVASYAVLLEPSITLIL